MLAKDLSDGKEPVSYAELDYLRELAESLPPQPLIVNIGAAEGLSTMTFLEARPDCFIFSVDVNPCPQELEHVRQGGHEVKRVVRLLGRSQEIGVNFPYKCDMIFIDGDHWGAAGDIESWVKAGKVKSGGVIAFHDWQPGGCAPNNPGSVTEDVTAGMVGYEKLGEAERVIAFRC